MPVAVMADSAFSFKKLLDQCENQELEAPGGIATPPVYGQLLALYLLHNDMNNARYLWKRIPPAIKSVSILLMFYYFNVIMTFVYLLLCFPICLLSLLKLTGVLEPITRVSGIAAGSPLSFFSLALDATRRRAFTLVSQAYTSIVAEDFAAFVGLPVEEAVKGILEQGWQADSTTRMVTPKKPVAGALDVPFHGFAPLSAPAPSCLPLRAPSHWGSRSRATAALRPVPRALDDKPASRLKASPHQPPAGARSPDAF
ncbi:COP9 signalosome complex subunit 8-like [Pteropus vampyrus]|uniref:COP9 signalosome complex subunit 8-like n=1 Tax=Pteropus vampyrus TaxID=132908 RepID=A0A6P6C0W2_PTEVA|nr:COP9 signalosome complex subunit 8-like [Pteropus vampyrus]